VVKVDGVIVNTVSGNSLSPLENGDHTVRVEATDAAGNIGASEVTFTVASLAPTVVIISPVSGISKNNAPTLTYRVSDGTVVVTVDGATVNKVSGNRLDTLGDGSHTVRVEAVNTSNYSDYDEVTFTVDTTPPTVSISSPISGATNLDSLPLIYSVRRIGVKSHMLTKPTREAYWGQISHVDKTHSFCYGWSWPAPSASSIQAQCTT